METLFLLAVLFCSEIDENRIDYCIDEITVCYYDGGLNEVDWCNDEYLMNEYLHKENNDD